MRLHPDQHVVDALPGLPGGVGVVVDERDRVVGTLSDSVARRSLLLATDPTTVRVGDVLDEEPMAVGPDATDEEVRALLAARHVRAVAVVADGRLEGLRRAEDVGAPVPPVSAVVLAGGRGERLQPLTFKVPKPLLTVGRSSILERVLESLGASGVGDVWLAVNYMADLIEERIGDGRAYGVRVRYLREHEPLETAGPLSLLPEPPPGPLVVMNADQITNLSFARMVDYHLAAGAAITVASFSHEVRIPYGVLTLEGDRLAALAEKPTVRWPCNAGFYVLDPAVLPLVPERTTFTMPQLLSAAMAEGHEVAVFPIVERWIDIGTPDELERALMWFATGEEV